MARKKSIIRQIHLQRELLKAMFGSWRKNLHLLDQIGSPGPTKSWLKVAASSKKPCIYDTQSQYPQLTVFLLTTDSTTSNYYDHYDSYSYKVRPNKLWSITRQDNNSNKILTVIAKAEYLMTYNVRRIIKHEITTRDKYDAENRVMNFTSVVECDGKFYALSLQGCLVVMEEKEDARLTITGICRTRVVPSCSVSAKLYDEYLIESRGQVFLVFLIYRERIGVADEVEVFRIDFNDELELVTVGGLGGRAFILEKSYSLWIDSREIGCCKGDCVYFFTGDMWRMYDLKSKSISIDEPVMYN